MKWAREKNGLPGFLFLSPLISYQASPLRMMYQSRNLYPNCSANFMLVVLNLQNQYWRCLKIMKFKIILLNIWLHDYFWESKLQGQNFNVHRIILRCIGANVLIGQCKIITAETTQHLFLTTSDLENIFAILQIKTWGTRIIINWPL